MWKNHQRWGLLWPGGVGVPPPREAVVAEEALVVFLALAHPPPANRSRVRTRLPGFVPSLGHSLLVFLLRHLPDLFIEVHFSSSRGHAGSGEGCCPS